MKKGLMLTLLLTVMVLGQPAAANLLENPGFEEGPTGQLTNVPIPGWSTWNTSGWHHDDAGVVIDTKAVKLWWTDSGIYQNFPAVAGHTYRFEGYMLHTSADPLRDPSNNPGAGDKTGEFRVEWYNDMNIMLREDAFGVITKDDPTDTWLFYTADLEAPAGTVTGRYLIRMYQPTAGDGAVNYDNASVYNATLYGQAYNPTPEDGATVEQNLAFLSWQNHEARNPEDIMSCDVYLEAEGAVIDPNFVTAPIATGVTSGMVDLAAAGVTLLDNTVYTWRVDTTDPNSGGNPILFEGPVWTFQIGDVSPTVNAGGDQYNWLTMEDGDGDPSKVTFTLTGTYMDDGKSPVTRAEWIQGNHEGGGTVAIESQTWTPGAGTHSAGTVEAIVSATGTGWLFLTLEVEDAIGVTSDTLNVGVYSSCLEAALEDPADNIIETTWPNGQHGDINGDCKTNLEDLAVMALSWLDCMTVKAGCTP